MSSMPDEINLQNPNMLPHVWIVKPDGKFYPARTLAHVNDGIIRMEPTRTGLRPVLTGDAIDAGYMFLEDACKAEPPGFYDALVDHLDKSLSNEAGKIDDDLLPSICRARREAARGKHPKQDLTKLRALKNEISAPKASTVKVAPKGEK